MSTVGFAQSAHAQQLPELEALRALGDLQMNRPDQSLNTTSPLDSVRGQQQNQQDQFQQLTEQQRLQREREAAIPSPLEADYRSRMFDAQQEFRQKAEARARQERIQRLQLLGETGSEDELLQGPELEKDPRLALKQFGYDIFSRPVMQNQLTVGRAPDDYVLGIGDQIVVSFHGSTQADYVTQIDREGRLVIRDLAPINAAGRTYADVAEEVRRNTEASLLGTQVFMSLGAVRTISVYILGEVREPGVRRVTSLSSVVEALSMAGGVKKTGTLRDIRVLRGGDVRRVDLYDVLTGAPGADLDLRDGDQIVVPPIGNTFAVTGEVNRPGIFELAPDQSRIPVVNAVSRAGGTLRPRGNAYLNNHIDDNGLQQIVRVQREDALQGGDMLHVSLMQNMRVGSVRVLGHVAVPGYVSVDSAPTLSELIYDVNLLRQNPYLPFAVVETTDPETQARVFRSVSLEKALRGTSDYRFQNSDWLYVFSMDDIKFLSSPVMQRVIVQGRLPRAESQVQDAMSGQAAMATGVPNEQVLRMQQGQELRASLEQMAGRGELGACRGLNHVARIIADTRSDRFANAVANLAVESFGDVSGPVRCPEIFDINEELLAYVLEHVVAVHGSVRRPGVYPIASEASLATLTRVTGGIMETADMSAVEVMEFSVAQAQGQSSISRHLINLTEQDPSRIVITSGSALRFNQVLSQQESGGILLTGEFVRPGFYTLRRGETLSQVIERAGGVTTQAYPYGAVFTRETAKNAQREGFRRAARELNAALTLAAVQEDANAAGLAAIQQTAMELETVEAAGRVVIEADPTVLRARPNLDVVLEPGDELHMPKRPSSVTVVGDVLNPGTLQFIPGKSVKEYLREAGGYQRTADKGRVFIVYPNGAAEPYSTGFAGFGSEQPLPPGTAIVVPKDLMPFNWRRFTVDMTQILGQLAVTAAALGSIN